MLIRGQLLEREPTLAARPLPPAPVGQPMTINRAAERAAQSVPPAQSRRPPREIDDLLPPAPIPNPGGRVSREPVGSIEPPSKNFFERLFGD